MCTEEITIPADQLEFSIKTSGWDWKDASNHLHYAIELKQKNGNKNPTPSSNPVSQVNLAGGGFVKLPNTAKVLGGSNSSKSTTVKVTTFEQGSKFIINFDFENFGARELYYDPTISTGTPNTNTAQHAVPITMLLVLMQSCVAFYVSK